MGGENSKRAESFSLSDRRPAVFLDRDGVLTEENGYIATINQLRIFSYAADCIRIIHAKGYYAIVVTNQSGIARGLFTEDTLLEMNAYLMEETGVDAVYYCPHHENGKIEKYRFLCGCRKPHTGLISKACTEFDIDMGKSWMIGDRASDIITGQNAGIRTVLTKTGYGIKRLEIPVKPDYIVEDLQDAVGLL